MNWYYKIIIAQEAQGLQGFLERLNAPQDIIQYILSQDKQTAQILTNNFRKNPSLTLPQLQSIQIPNTPKIDPYFKTEKIRARNLTTINSPFYNWILVNCRKLRRGLPINKINKDEQIKYWSFVEGLGEIRDWYNAIIPNISSFTIEQAKQASDEWHQQMAGKGKGTFYNQTDPKLIIYGPNWENKEYNGWTIQKITSENDLTCEGNKMDHCVGGYYDNVECGFSIIYSLRDPNNNPHVTIETNDYNEIEQIQGKSNSEPKDIYKNMIKEWINSPENPGIDRFSYEEDPFDEISLNYGTIEEISQAIEKVKNGGEYGIKPESITDATDIIELAINIERKSRNPEYSGDITSIPEEVIDLIFETNENNPEEIIKQIKFLEEFCYEKLEEVWDYAVNWDINDSYISEEINRTPSGGICNDILKIINELREKKQLPSYEDMNKTYEETRKKELSLNQNH